MDIADAGLVERGRELALGEAGPARGRHRAGIDHEVDCARLSSLSTAAGVACS